MVKYYDIDEAAAKAARDANSFYEYVPGSATAAYHDMVDAVVALAEKHKAHVDASYHGKIDQLVDQYARQLAAVTNESNRVEASVPSIMIAGGSNFPVRKKERQNARRDAVMQKYRAVDALRDKIRSVGTGGIRGDDPNARERLQKELDLRRALQQHAKDVNAYYRRHKTLEGCTIKPLGNARKLEGPFAPWQLSNNLASIHRIEDRIKQLDAEAERAAAGVEDRRGAGYTLHENPAIGRIQLIFDGKPDDEVRALLKANGFRWAPSEGAWQRQLTDNARRAAEAVITKLEEARA